MEGVNFLLFLIRFAAWIVVVSTIILTGIELVVDRIVSRNSKGHEDDGRT